MYQKLSNKGFTSTVLEKIKPNPYSNPTAEEMGNKDVICFVRQKDSNNIERVREFIVAIFQSDKIWYSVVNSSVSLTNMLTSTSESSPYSGFGCLLQSNTDWGAQKF